jgi:hypothetical protein
MWFPAVPGSDSPLTEVLVPCWHTNAQGLLMRKAVTGNPESV